MTGCGPEALDSEAGLGDRGELSLKPCKRGELFGKISELLNRG